MFKGVNYLEKIALTESAGGLVLKRARLFMNMFMW